MSILADNSIIENYNNGNIKIVPFNYKNVGSNSYDLHLSSTLKYYPSKILDCKGKNDVEEIEMTDKGIVLLKGRLYLGSTIEYTETHNLHPCIQGKSSLARYGLLIHVTAGFGDIGFCGHWTLEIMSLGHDIRIYPGMPICQIFYHTIEGECSTPYNIKKSAKYNNQPISPVESRFYKEFTK